MKFKTAILFLLTSSATFAQEVEREIYIQKKYLNFPVQSSRKRQEMTLRQTKTEDRKFVIRLSDGKPDYWVFSDVSDFIGKRIQIAYPEDVKGFHEIYQSDEINGSDSLYREKNRPKFHFTTRRGWINDPNGLLHANGEYHLFYQHNPYERSWENMHWGHAASKDLLHWAELPEALYPDTLGTMFSGSAVVDERNTSGFKTGKNDVIVAAYTAHGRGTEVQCIAYSNDRGRTFTKYAGNPVIDSGEKWNTRNLRDPKIFHHRPSGKWVMALFEKTGISIYHSDNLKEWTYQSHISGFWECPDLFELPVDGNPSNTKWVLYGASGTYLIGTFDGKTFTPETDKLCYVRGNLYAAQTFNHIPEKDGRRIQIGWGNIDQPGMPFNSMMTFPTELTLRSTREGVRMFSEPVREIEQLYGKSYSWKNLTPEEANRQLRAVGGDAFRIQMKVRILDGADFQLSYNGNSLLHYDMNRNNLNGEFYGGSRIETLTFYYDVLIDKTVAEIFADHGRFSLVNPLPSAKNGNGFEFRQGSSEIGIEEIHIHEIRSVWH
ncbi:MAG: glycoside hydrolase family 32 protein [Bacteroidales bacterium]|jgi:sucrose-6-phosphate hydrolase SacC (GH32 family)|nr:glycoside hydrolase family 32 protein [Bacteroidales bacterium]